jgi:hypothetical protein
MCCVDRLLVGFIWLYITRGWEITLKYNLQRFIASATDSLIYTLCRADLTQRTSDSSVKSPRSKKTRFNKMKKILQGDSKVSKHRLWYLRVTLVRSADSRSLDWSPWSRGKATSVSRPHPTWFFTRGGIWRPWCNRWKYKTWSTYRCISAPNTRFAKASSPWVEEKDPYVISKHCCPHIAGFVNEVTILPIYWDFCITLCSITRAFWNIVLCQLKK